MSEQIKKRLEYLRGEIKAERISYEEIAELQGLKEHIDPSDVLLLQWAGVEEHEEAPKKTSRENRDNFLASLGVNDYVIKARQGAGEYNLLKNNKKIGLLCIAGNLVSITFKR
ncbi:hypothetical protein HGB13_00120 [bacterium]|nr:hypothetical protein [bacterium]